MCSSNLSTSLLAGILPAPQTVNKAAFINVGGAKLAGNTPEKIRRNSPLKLWELHSRRLCPVIGTCLDIAELRKILRQSKIQVDACSDYELHSMFVAHADNPNRLSKLVQKHLEKKYANYRKRFAAATDSKSLLALWREAWKQGDIAGAFWATLTHPALDEETGYEIYGQVHMLSHQVGALQRADLGKLHRLQQRELELLEQIKELWQTAQVREQHLLDAQQELQSLRLARQTSIKAKDDEAERIRLREQLQQARQESALLHERFDAITQHNLAQQGRIEQLEMQLRQTQSETEALERQLEAVLVPQSSCDNCELSESPRCPAAMPGQRILYVGGRDKLKPHFRSLVEQHYGGEFAHHDGGLHGKENCLHQALCQADMVFCPIDCISHNACHAIKRHCKKHNKPMVILRTESLSAFSLGLQESLS